jgi:hypothetical protein
MTDRYRPGDIVRINRYIHIVIGVSILQEPVGIPEPLSPESQYGRDGQPIVYYLNFRSSKFINVDEYETD